MAAKTKSKNKAVKRSAAKATAVRKSSVSKLKQGKPAKPASRRNGKPPAKSVPQTEVRSTSRAGNGNQKSSSILKARSREYSNAIHAYESGLKLMHNENYEKAIRAFNELIADH